MPVSPWLELLMLSAASISRHPMTSACVLHVGQPQAAGSCSREKRPNALAREKPAARPKGARKLYEREWPPVERLSG